MTEDPYDWDWQRQPSEARISAEDHPVSNAQVSLGGSLRLLTGPAARTLVTAKAYRLPMNTKEAGPWPAWDAPELQASSDSPRVARYRLQQSWYREHVLNVGPGERPGRRDELVGNTLDPAAVEADRTLNFLNSAAHQAAVRRAREVQEEGGTLEEGRLFHNMLSSMTMCFNLFGAIGELPAFVDIVRSLFDSDAAQIDQVICEINPTDALGDRTAFDAMIRYRDEAGAARFVGIETKYTEPFSPKKYDNDRYQEVTSESNWFVDGAADALVGSSTNQLWRGLMLASLTEDETGTVGRYAVVTPADDAAAIAAVARTCKHLTEPEQRLRVVTIEQIADAAAEHGDARLGGWAELFRARYLDFQQSR